MIAKKFLLLLTLVAIPVSYTMEQVPNNQSKSQLTEKYVKAQASLQRSTTAAKPTSVQPTHDGPNLTESALYALYVTNIIRF